ncbi:midasin [Clonorchis sinensis]|uniref:Midasin n=2 Tax=Clonorchis sinensis TaxID=79923 RepID=G7YPI3_CLOSI|nr:midasin [Clonorchis sinensis]
MGLMRLMINTLRNLVQARSKRKPPVSATEDVHPKRVKHESPESFETKSAHIILPGLENASPVPIIISKRDTEATFVRLPLIHSCITSLSVCTELRKPVLLAGPVGCGKTRCIDFVACVRKASVCRVQISEQTDSKSLLGAYCCTETPGQFVWRPGPLLTSLTQGSWLVLEDVDRGPADLQMLLAPLFKPNHSSCHRLDLIDPTTGLPVDQHRNFRILMTRRLVLSRTNEWRMECDNPCAEFIDRHCSVIMLPALNDDSLRQLVSRLYPSLHTLLDRILTIYGCVREDLESSSAFTGSRTISPRDLLKFCARIARPSVESLQSDCLLLHAVDCFVACVPDPSRLLQLASKIAGELNLSAEKVMFILYKRSVDLRLDTDGAVMYLGRAQLPCHRTAEWEARLASAATLSQSTGDVVAPFASTHLACTLLERLAVAVEHKEPVLLVGETGTGKTSAIQQLAHLCGRRLRVINLNQQSDSVDLLGGFKPVDTRSLVRPVRERFEALFCRTFRMDKNIGYLEHINEYFNSGQWRDLITLMQHPTRLAVERPAGSANLLHEDWLGLLDQLNQLQRRFENAAKTNQSAVGFAFIEGALVRAVQDGDWVLLDEINLAPAEMLDCLSGLLDSDHGSVTLVERGDKTPLKRNPDFHLFAAMNPSTDVGKRELPVGLRNRFTEIYVPELDPGINDSQLNPIRATDREDLAILIRAYLLPLNPSPTQLTTVVRLYAALRQAAVEGLVDGVGQKPHFSLRTLCRALVEAGRGYHGGIIRSLYEGLIFSFGSQLSRASRPVLDTLVRRYLALIHGTREQKPDHTSLSHLLSSPLPMPVHRPALKDQSSAVDYLPVEGYWVPRGPGEPRQTSPDALVDGSYVLTPSVRANLKDLARVVAAGGSLPILLQGETSVGKTSLITYLAERIGQVCYRINNHEHTEQQTYLGTYTVASATAQANMKDGTPPPLVFQHGPLVQAMRLGHWIILDELNLAPTEILEALNRVLDDNRTLFIPDTQEVIRAHPQFRLFATQNPPGLYAGRKVLSRALRNRFIELHFDPIPRGELEVILEKRCALPQSRAHRLVEVMHRLQLARCQSNVFLGKDSFITLRDLFRWAERYRLATCDLADPENCAEKRLTFFDWDAYLAEQGYLLLAGRVRNAEETRVVAEALEAVFKRPISEAKLFDLSEETSSVSKEFLQPLLSESDVRPVGFEHVVWTRDMRRMLVLIGNALKYKEPILLVGETSCGKTTVCQLFAALKHQKLHCVNCHQYTEAGDFLGGLRPIRRVSSQDGAEVDDGRLFEWVDGPLVVAMSRGEMFLLDEISLADDAVLERLNSLLEPERRLNLAERSEGAGSIGVLETNDLTAHIGFRLVATMNPGGDYGKKELSPALRNRFTEIWCPTPAFTSPNIEDFPTSSSDLQLIVVHNLKLHLPLLRTSAHLAERLSYAMVDFASWFSWALHDDTIANHLVSTRKSPPTIRDLLAWIQFMESVCSRSSNPASTPPRLSSSIDLLSACLHGACLVFLDAVDCKPIGGILEGPSLAAQGVKFLRERLESIALEHDLPVENLFIAAKYTCAGDNSMDGGFGLTSDGRMFGADPFYIDTGPSSDPNLALNSRFNFSAPTPAVNLRRLLRALQVPKRALLLEGSPGVGKTSLVLALAKATGHDVVRINLSEATEASDLLGCDLPVEGAAPGVFGWRDGPLLQGLREGRWIVLDEMNLASQSVLECLNACLDHRGELYIPELGATFKIQPGATRLFACQNPVREGGGRKGLPKSFLNRFTQVFLQPLTRADQEFIMRQLYPRLPAPVVQLMVHFNWKLADEVNVAREFGTQGGPWEFNLRDLMRWAELILKGENFEGSNPGLSVHYVYTDRMRTEADKRKIAELWNSVCRERGATDMVYYKPLGRVSLVNNILRIGVTGFDTVPTVDPSKLPNLLLLDHQRSQLESLLKILEMGWMAILVGPPGCGKRTLTNICATLVGHPLSTMHMSPTADTVELLGSLEQHEAGGHFCWIDSPLVKGMRHGHWVVIESAQLCSPSVLDRLNSVLEPDGELILSERGLDSNGRLIRLKPHPNFRLILIVDEVSGAGAGSTGVSRAMRNRGVEIAVYKDLSMTTVDLDRILTSIGIRNSVVNALTSFQALFSTACGLTCSQADHINLLDGLPLTAGLLKRPPIGALLSCSQLAESLLQNPETDEAEPRQLFLAEPEDFLTFDLDRPKTVWCWALSRALNFAYSSRQTHAKAVSVVRTLINRFLSVVSDEISLESMYHRSGGVGPRYLLHSLPQVISCDSFPQPTADPWELWPDLRWIPGWQHLTNSVGGTVLEWDRVLRTLLAVELLQMQMELVPPKSSINQSLETLSSLSVLVVAHKCSIGQIPTTWLENYPGLNAILDQWTQFLQTFVAERTVERPGTSHAYWLSIIQRVGLIWTWLHQFALRPLGDPQDWSDRLDFHNQRANLSTVDVNGFIHILGAIRSVLSLPAPRVVPFTNSEFSPMTLNCVSFGKKIGELLQLLQFGELEEEDEDGLNDESLTDEGGLVHHEEVRDNPTSNLMCLWPLSMLSTLHTIDQMAEDQRQSEPLRALVRCLLLNMTRPQLMTLLSLAQPCHVSSSVQKRAVEQSLLEISEKQAFEQLYAHLDLVSTGCLLPYRSFGTLERPSLINEWRSLGQATFAITWPALSRYNLGAEPTHQTLFGWFNSQKAYRIAHVMLSSHVRSPHGATYSSCRSSSVNAMTPNPNLTDLVLKSGQLLHAVNEALVTKVHSSTVHHTPMHPDSSFSETHPDLDSLLEWIASKLQPRLSESVFMASASPDWSEILQLCEWFIGYMLKIKDDPSNSDLIGIAWTLFGCLYLRCACPVAPLDPYIVARVEEAAVATELERVDREIELRRAIRRISFGNPSGALPKDGDDSNEWFSATNLQGLVEAGLEHPWISALVTYREQLVEKSEQLAKHNVLSRGPIPLSRQVSNIQILRGLRIWTHYGSLRMNMKSATVTDLVGLLSTGLMSNQTVIDRPLSLNCLSSSLYLACQLTSISVRNTLKQTAIAVSLEANPSGPTQTLAFQVEFRLFSLILDLIWLHHVDSIGSHDYQLTSFMGRLLAFLNRPLARRWQQAEADRKKAAAERAALFIEAASQKHRIQGELQQGSKSKKDNARDVQADLIDPDLVEEVEWRLRFPETASLNALAEMSAESRQFGLGREEQIQQTVRKLEQVDKWLERALGETTRTWIPDESELIYWVDRTVELLLSQDTNVIAKARASEWRWHTLLSGYSMASWLTLHHSSVSLDPSTDRQSLSTLLAITAYLAQNDLRSKARLPIYDERNASLDVYRDPIPLDAASKLLTVLEHLERRVRQILHEWPGQPSLVHEWEKNASRHVSLMDQIKEVCEILIEWRKMELKCWLSTLDSATSAFSNRAATLWFHLHDVFLRPPGHATSDSTVGKTQSESDRCEVLVELMENGPLGEFPMRWRLLAALRTALDIWPGLPTQDRETNKRIVGNVVWFYGQFLSTVQNEIKCLRKPIEKELRGVVHITKWGDYACFWSVKSNVDRCKRTIHKQVRNWETVLRRPVRPLFETAISVPRFERLPDADCPNMPVSSLPSASDVKNYWLSPLDFQWICNQRTMNPRFGSHFGISGENASHSCSDLDCDTTSDAVDTELMGSDVGLNSFDDNTSLPQLGLSYLRGQRYSHTGSMTPFLSQLNGDPWRYVHSHEGTDLYRIGSKEYTLPTIVCRRLACLVALRGGLPRTPGPPGATPETVSAIVTELGGPTNLARLTGLADDLLNNCVVAIRSCSQLTEAANQLFAHSDAFRSSLDGKANSCSSDVAKDDVVYAPLGSDHIQLRRIRTSVKTVGQLARDALQQCTLFWGVCHQLQSITPVTTEDLKCIFGSELWDNLVAPVARPSIDVFADLCRHICTNYLDRLTAAVETISEDVNLLSASPAFLLTYPSCQIYARLSTALESFLSVSDAIVSDCRQHGFHNNVEWSLARTADRLRSEYQFLSTVVTQDPLRALHCEELSKEECGDALCVLTDNLIQSILRTLGTLYHADRHSKDMGQIDLLLQFSSEMSVSASDLISAQVNKWLTRCRAKLEQSDGDVLTSGVRLARAVFPLVDALSKAAEVRATQFWQLLDEWTRLGERVLRITGRLLVDGFCRPAGLDRSMSDEATGGMSCDNQALDSREQEGSGGGTSLTAEGVDTTGAKDVSKELECQEQIEGLMDDTQKANQADDRGAAEDESEGIEMPDDNFHGEFGDDQPLGIDEQEDELSSADETQDLENRMGDGASGASDEVFKEMWASDNEEEEPASTIPPAENDTGGVQDQTNGKQDEKGTRDSSDVQRQKKSLDTDQPAQEKNEEANLGEAESSPPPKKGPKSAKDFQNKTTVAGDEGQMLPNNEQELTPDAESEQDHSTDGDQARKEDESLAALEAKRLEDEEETTGKQTEDLPDDLPDEAMNSPSEEAGAVVIPASGLALIVSLTIHLTVPANADSGKPEEESGQDEVDRGYEDQIMPLDQDAKDQTELQDPKMEDFQYNPASGDLGQDKATAGLDGAPANEDKRPTEYDHEQDSVQQLPEQTEQSTGNRGAQRVGTSQFGDLAPDQLDAEDRSAPTVKTEGTTSKRRSGLKPVSENRSQDPSATDAMKKKEILDPAKSGQVRSPEIDQEGLTDADLYEHMEEDLIDTGNDSGIRAFDSATERQRKQQTRSEQKRDQTDTDVGLEHDEETSEEQSNLIPTDVPEEQSLSSGLPLQQQRPSGKSSKGDLSGDVVESDPDARIVATLGAQRPPDSFICTRPEALVQSTAGSDMIDVSLAVELADLRSISTEDAKEAFFEWSACSARSAGLARQLCESLRLVLEPTKAARMRGDYRTGKRINMRKIIPYLASHFRKDKIWLRRSQPSQREYRILIAVDDSSSMSDNLCRQMTFDALATVVTALNLLEVGRIGVCSFGESVRILHDLQDTWIGDAGANVLAQFTFKQSRTSLIQLLQSAIKAMQMCNLPTTTGSMPSQLLLILSDGVFSEDPQDPKVQAAVRLARDSRLFPVCLILDDVRKKHSIFDLRRYTSNGKLVPYMDTFPLPFYLVLRDVTALPQLLSDALRQWFELEASFGR